MGGGHACPRPAQGGCVLKGFTLIEALVALAVISVAFLAVLHGSAANLRAQRRASDLSTAAQAAEYLMQQVVAEGYPPSGEEEGVFEEGPYSGLGWTRSVQVVELPYIEELKLVTVEVRWSGRNSYRLETVLTP
ncbi:MAG: type IV pilus modification PilV family protein [Spirochaetota bacterium]